ncbi:MAG TPA: diaminobutyrate--2-oxoglutarate transaminase [Polyangiales bacterium]|nr:diaminobutyrate--2-oxoglutarate transaminase [Polyangiales bacterium]
MNIIFNCSEAKLPNSVASDAAVELESKEHSSRLHVLGQPELLRRQAQRESNARSYPRRIPIAIKRASGLHVEDVEGRVFIDCLSCAGALALGHNHPVIVEALQRALRDQLPLQTLDLTTPAKDAFVEELFAMLPRSFARRAKIQFCGPTGTDGVEAALKLTKTATQRANVLAFHGAYHGMSHGALALMGNLGPKRDLPGLAGNVQFLPFPYAYRCPFGLGGQAGEDTGIAYIESVLRDPESGVVQPAAMILEPIQGEGGVIPASARWLSAMRELTRRHDVPLVLDEVQSGLGRTGSFFAFEHAEIEPDVLVLSKAIGGGLPLSVVVYDEALDKWAPGAHAGTFRGNQLAMVAGLATLQTIRSARLDLHARELGARLMAHLERVRRSNPLLGDVRGRGLMIGVEIVNAAAARDALGSHPAHAGLASALQTECLRRGLIIELGGRHGSVVRFLPPLVITAAQIDEVAQIFEASVETVAARLG